MHRSLSRIRNLSLATALLASFVATTTAAPVHADAGRTWWVATDGTPADPELGGTRCDDPDFVGTNQYPILSAISSAASGDHINICSGTYTIGETLPVGIDLTFVGVGDTQPIFDGQRSRRIMSIVDNAQVVVTGIQFVNALWWVSTTGTQADSQRGGTDCDNPDFKGTTGAAIQAAINAASDGDGIRVCGGIYSIGSTLTVGKDLTFFGDTDPQTVFDGGHSHRIMNVADGVTVSVERIQFQHGAKWWVSTSGTAANPTSSGTSCANPSFVGSTDVAIQSAISAASSGDEIHLCDGFYRIGSTISVDKQLSISGEGTRLPVLDGGNARRIMSISAAGLFVTVERLQFQNGRLTGNGEPGAGIKGHSESSLTVTDSFFVRNRADDGHGGAISLVGADNQPNSGVLHVSGSTFYRNSGIDGGAINTGGMQTQRSTITNSTFVENSASRDGGAVNGTFGNLAVAHSTFLDNKATYNGFASYKASIKFSIITNSLPIAGDDENACFISNYEAGVGNITDFASCRSDSGATVNKASLKLSFLAPWGGSTPTVAIAGDSAAVGAVSADNCPDTDQRGASRAGTTCDAGAVEFTDEPVTLLPSSDVPISLLKGRAITNAPTYSSSDLMAPITFRVATEFSGPLTGTTINPTTGKISGTPSGSHRLTSLIISAVDVNGKHANAILDVQLEDCSPVDGKYLIRDIGDLDLFMLGACGFDSNYVVTADIAWDGPWDAVNSFSGTFDGGGHSITGLQIGDSGVALFGSTNGGTIKDLNFEADVTGSNSSAGLVSNAQSTTIQRVNGTGSVTTSADGSSYGCFGGLVGEAGGTTTITDSSYIGTVDGPDRSWNGGLVGCAYNGSIISKSYFKGTVKGISSVGGLIGWMEGAQVVDSYAEGVLIATDSEVGGLVGRREGDGSNDNSVAIRNSYANIEFQTAGATKVGGILGWGNSQTLVSSFWDSETAGISLEPFGGFSDVGGTQPDLTGTPTSSLKSRAFFVSAEWGIVNGWSDPSTVEQPWGICVGESRPFLLWQYTSSPCPSSQDDVPPPTDNTPPGNNNGPSDPTGGGTSPTTTVPSGSTTNTSVKVPPVRRGGSAVYVGGVKVNSLVAWSGSSRITGTIGGVNMSVVFDPKGIIPSIPSSLVAGTSFTMSLRGLKPGSTTTATIFSVPTALGQAKVSANGTLNTRFTVPANLRAGSHHLRIEMVDSKGRTVTVWLGVAILSSTSRLPMTGSSENVPMLMTAFALMCVGTFFRSRRRHRIR